MLRRAIYIALAAVTILAGSTTASGTETDTTAPEHGSEAPMQATEQVERRTRYDGPCSQVKVAPNHMRRGETKRASKRFARCLIRTRWPVPGRFPQANKVATGESGWFHRAWNRTGCNGASCKGIFQQHMSYWRGRARHYLRRRWGLNPRRVSAFNPKANIIVSLRMAMNGWEPDWSATA